MIIYDLICDAGHGFEGWFKNAEDLTQQRSQGLLSCPFCDSLQVEKKLTAAKVTRKSNSAGGDSTREVAVGNQQSPQQFAEVQKMLHKMHNYIDSNFEDVGNQFSQEAISIQRGDREAANIRGTANKDQLREMADEGVQVLPIPPRPINKNKLN